jgi:hypothetical protein
MVLSQEEPRESQQKAREMSENTTDKYWRASNAAVFKCYYDSDTAVFPDNTKRSQQFTHDKYQSYVNVL